MLRSWSEGTIRKGDRRLSDSKSKAMVAAEAASSKKASDVVILEVGPLIGITDFFVIATGNNERQVATIAEEVDKQLREAGLKPYRREGEKERRWVLLDYLDIVVHVFHKEDREFYELERLWKDAPKLDDASDKSQEEVS